MLVELQIKRSFGLNASESINEGEANTFPNHLKVNPLIGKVIVAASPKAVTAIIIKGTNKNAKTKIEKIANALFLRIDFTSTI